jgi:enoyl-CoA hydratase/carnithine racemase
MTPHVTVTREGAVQILRLTRPEKKNALSTDMYGALCDALVAGDASADVAAHVILGSNGVFTAGNDIADFLATSKGTGGVEHVLRFIQLLPVIKKPLIAGVDGLAVGIGTTLLFHCDLVYASPAAKFSTPFLDLGLVPEAGSSLLFPRTMGYARAYELLVLGNVFSAEQGREAGFINEVIPALELEAKVKDTARRLAAKPPEALTLSKALLRGDVSGVVQRVNEEAELFRKRLSSPEAREAFTAFAEKRAPDFSKFAAKG